MKSKTNIITLFTKAIVYFVFIIAVVVCFSVVPKTVLNNNQIYSFSASICETKKDLVLFDYEVFGSKKRFETALETNVPLKRDEVRDRREVLIVKVYADQYKEEFIDNYWFITDPSTPELNIEYYIASSVTILNSTLPCFTFIGLMEDIMGTVNIIYLLAIIIASLGFITPLSISTSKNIYYIIGYYKKRNNEIVKQ